MKNSGFTNRIEYPSPSIVTFIERINGQLNIDFANADSSGYGDTLGTLTASRRISKPFIIGFIPPDNPIDFVPIEAIKVKLGTISTHVGSV
ncbi:MAG TPA: hypothetical protein ENI76_01675, partial [Ignavibacteria bacterium]|nr:hypothetical protein [Ignavibacteria bacterium]